MGGRGSGSGKSGGGGGGGVSYTAAQEAKMPELSGSPKQVSWAEDIRRGALAQADHLVEDAARGQDGEWWRMSASESDAVSLQSAKETRTQVINAYQNMTSAKAIIDNRANLSANAVLRTAKAVDRQNGRKFENPKKQKKPPVGVKVHTYATPKS